MKNELEMILESFRDNFANLKGKRIALYEGTYENEIYEEFSADFHFLGIIREEGETEGKYISRKDLDSLRPDAVILTAHRVYPETDYFTLSPWCRENGVLLLDFFGLDMTALHDEFDSKPFRTLYRWKKITGGYDVISFTIIHTFLNERPLLPGKFGINRILLDLYRWLKKEGKEVCFIYRRSFGEEMQKQTLFKAGISEDDRFFERVKGDLGYREVRKAYPGKKILHIGNSFPEDFIIPRYYGVSVSPFIYDSLDRRKKEPRKAHERITASLRALTGKTRRNDVISFDIFDTLLFRPFLDPEDLFTMIEEKTGLSDYRKRRIKALEALDNPSLVEIYDAYSVLFAEDRGLLREAEELEVFLERELLKPRKRVVDVYNTALGTGKPVVLVTDMHLSGEVLDEILLGNGISGYKKLYISSEYGKRKQEGLFDEVRKDYPGKTILHIGDDSFADVSCALDAGLDAFHIPSVRETAELEEVHEMCRTSDEMSLVGLAAGEAFENPFEAEDPADRFASLLFMPMNAAYLSFLRKKLSGRTNDMLLFSGRDGFPLLSSYELMREKFEDLPEYRYLETSRHAAFLLFAADESKASYFDSFYKKLSTAELLEKVWGLEGRDYVLDENLNLKENLKLNRKQLLDIQEENRRGFDRYLDGLGIERDKNLWLMDFISSGTSLGLMSEYLEKDMKGLFYSFPTYQNIIDERIESFLDVDGGLDFDTLLAIEAFMTSEKPSLDRYKGDGKRIYQKEPRSEEQLALIKKVHEKAVPLMEKYITKLYSGSEINGIIIEKLLEKIEIPETKAHDDWVGEDI